MCDVPCNIEVTHVDPILHNKNRICIESDQNIKFRFYMPFHIKPCRSDFRRQCRQVISDAVFLHGQKIHSERKTKKNERKQKHRSDSTWFFQLVVTRGVYIFCKIYSH